MVRALAPVQKENASFKKPPHLHPTWKASAPFHTWAIDLIGPMTPPGPAGEQFVVVAVDVFTKWVEAYPLKNKASSTVARWFHRDVVCRYGLPYLVRSDNGKEFAGEFTKYLQHKGIKHSLTFPYHPRANGLVERYNGVIKTGLRKLASQLAGSNWMDHLPEVLAGLRFLPTHLGISPYTLAYKQEPRCLVEHLAGPKVMMDLEPEGDKEVWAR